MGTQISEENVLSAQLVLVLQGLGKGPHRDGAHIFEEGVAVSWHWYLSGKVMMLVVGVEDKMKKAVTANG